MRSVKFLLGILFFLSFVGFSYLVQKNVFQHFDFDTTVRLQDHIDRRFDIYLSILSLLGSVEFVGLILLFFLFLKRNLGLFFFIPFTFLSIHLFELFGKLFVRHPGPPFMFFRYDINFLFPSSYVKPGFSYPSGHSARATFVSVVILYFIFRSKKFSPLLKKIVLLLFLIFNIVMMVSRIYLGEHWASDVIGGGLLGMSLGLFSVALF